MRKYGLIGKSLSHSFSAKFFNEKFQSESIDAIYELIELADENQLESFLKENDFSGFNVTIPYKEKVLPFLNELSAEAKEIGAVNCIVKKDGKLIGHNTDAFGFKQSIKPFLTNLHERALILGTGGSSKAVEFVFKSIGINCIFVSRSPKQGQFAYSEINQHMVNACKVIVNCTPVGMYPNVDEVIDFPYHFLSKEHLLIDLIYNPLKTNFLKKSEENSAQILNGESMLKEQALKSWELWNN
jgi:shikimate dehydrogenase